MLDNFHHKVNKYFM